MLFINSYFIQLFGRYLVCVLNYQKERTMASHDDHDIGVDHPDSDHARVTVDKAQCQHSEKEKDRKDNTYSRERYRDIDKRVNKHDNSRDISVQRFPHKRKSTFRVEDTVSEKWHPGGEGDKNSGVRSLAL